MYAPLRNYTCLIHLIYCVYIILKLVLYYRLQHISSAVKPSVLVSLICPVINDSNQQQGLTFQELIT